MDITFSTHITVSTDTTTVSTDTTVSTNTTLSTASTSVIDATVLTKYPLLVHPPYLPLSLLHIHESATFLIARFGVFGAWIWI